MRRIPHAVRRYCSVGRFRRKRRLFDRQIQGEEPRITRMNRIKLLPEIAFPFVTSA